MRYVDGDYNDPQTFAKLKQALGGAKRPLHYLAIPPSLFGVVVSALANSGLNVDARLVVEKPFGRDSASAQTLNHTLLEHFPENAIFRIDHYLGKGRFRTFSIRASPMRCSSRSGIAIMFAASRSPWR